ncbi:MAG TPA: glycosyltransferase family 39 protein [bacterium]|nr:glycosyltransferase family 39 protein [bacterium]
MRLLIVRHPALVVFIVALLLRFAYVPLAVNLPFNDMGCFWYDGLAIASGAGMGESLNYPLYSYFLAGLIRLFGPLPAAVHAVQAVLGAGIPLLAFLLGSRIHNVRAGWFAGAATALFPDLIFYCAIELPETIYLLLLLTAALNAALLLAGTRSWWPVAALGAVLGLAQLARPFGLHYLVALTLLLVLYRRRIPSVWAKLALMFGLALLVGLPWAMRQYYRYGVFSFTSTKAGYFLYGATVDVPGHDGLLASFPEELRRDPTVGPLAMRLQPSMPPGASVLGHPLLNAPLERLAKARIAAHPGTYARHCIERVFFFFFRNGDWFLELYPTFGLARGWWYDTLIYGVLLLGAVGMIRACRQPAALPLVALIVLSAMATAATVYVTRYRLPVMPPMLIFAAVTLADYSRLARWSAALFAIMLFTRLLQYPGLADERYNSARFFLLFNDRTNASRNLDAISDPHFRHRGSALLLRYDTWIRENQ